MANPRYETHIAPLLKQRCVRCHNDQAQKAELDLSTPQGLFKGGESGAAVVPGKLDESYLYDMVHEGAMPPEGEGQKLSARELEILETWISSGAPFAGETDPAELVASAEVNNHEIEPLMLLRCAVCHGLRVQEGGLDLRTKTSMLKGGKSGPAIVLGRPKESLLLKRIHSGEMPPKKLMRSANVRPMESGELAQLARWIELGAPEVQIQPDVASTTPDPLVSDEDRQHWAFQTPQRPKLPTVASESLVQNPIDAFVLHKLEDRGLSLNPPADKLALIRRASFDLLGLPPAQDEVERFLADESPDAYARLIDRLLQSPHYGERWARHWLDLAGYADSEGKRSADPLRPYAYKYRDYVIRSLNADKPYDRFLTEQIAGDELEDLAGKQQLTQAQLDNLIATGFLRMAPDGTGSDPVNFVEERIEVISDEIDVFSSGVLGLTMKCARCHTHKYDPLPQRDYYRLTAVFRGAFDEHDWLKPNITRGQSQDKGPGRFLYMGSADEFAEVAEEVAKLKDQRKEIQQQLKAIEAEVRQQYTEKQLAALSDEVREDVKQMLSTPAADRDEAQQELAKKFEKKLRPSTKELANLPDYKKQADPLNKRLTALDKTPVPDVRIRALWDRGDPSPAYMYRRGDPLQPARLVGPGVPSVLTDGKTPFDVQPPWPGAKKSGRRLALAKWLTQPDNPLTARVMINRVWYHHFGRGIVDSLTNFGKLAATPTHPELLDYLATEFVGEQDWSLKQLHRMIMTSATYQQSSLADEDRLALDPDGSLLSRMPLRRLSAEELRDSMLAVSGTLNTRQFGEPDPVTVRKDGLVTVKPADGGGYRRSIYVLQRRTTVPTVLETFDLPQMNPNCAERTSSTVAQQALYMLNNGRVLELSEALAARIAQAAGTDHARQIDQLFRTAISRPPTDAERELLLEQYAALIAVWSEQAGADEAIKKPAEALALESLCHTVLNSAAFLYVD